MKRRTCLAGLFAAVSAASLVALNVTAQTSAETTTTSTPTAADSTPVKLPYGVEDVLKLSRAQVNEDVTLNYIHNSGTIYNLGPNDIVYLRNEGVSDRVINTMLDQRKNVPAEAATQTAQAGAVAGAQAPAGTTAAAQAPTTPEASAVAAPQYAPVYVETPPPSEPASTLYVIPYPYPSYGYPVYRTYYPGYGYPCYGASVVFTIGHRGGGCYRGGHCGPSYGGHGRPFAGHR